MERRFGPPHSVRDYASGLTVFDSQLRFFNLASGIAWYLVEVKQFWAFVAGQRIGKGQNSSIPSTMPGLT